MPSHRNRKLIIFAPLAHRHADLKEVKVTGSKSRMLYHCPSRTLLGFRTELNQATRGEAVIHCAFHSYGPYMEGTEQPKRASLISNASGKTSGYALQGLEARGVLFVEPGEDTYEGMVIGESAKGTDITVNPAKQKHLTNVRAAGKEEFYRLMPPKKLPLEEAITFISEDELLEVTPVSLRIRKEVLSTADRERLARRNKKK